MISKKISQKIKSKCGDDKSAYNALIDLLEYEDSGVGKQNIHCRNVVESYTKEFIKYENQRDKDQEL